MSEQTGKGIFDFLFFLDKTIYGRIEAACITSAACTQLLAES